MSIEVRFHPKLASRKDLEAFLRDLGFEPSDHLWEWPEGSKHFFWFEAKDFRSFDGVEATIFPPSLDEQRELGPCQWALHTRTRASASPADKEQQNHVTRQARARFGGNFYNDWFGRNRYSRIKPDSRNAAGRGVYLAYEHVSQSMSAVRFSLPPPNAAFEGLNGTMLEALTKADPSRVLYNALVPFAVASLEHFLSQCFRILLQYASTTRAQLAKRTTKVEMSDVLAIQNGERTIEEVVTDSYSFQSLKSVHSAYSEWLGIDFWRLLRRRRKVGSKLPVLSDRYEELIRARHDVVHRLSMNPEMTKGKLEEILELVTTIVDTVVDHLEKEKGLVIRD